MYHRSAGKKSTILSIPGNSRAETELLPFFLPQAAGPVKKKEEILVEMNSILYNIILMKELLSREKYGLMKHKKIICISGSGTGKRCRQRRIINNCIWEENSLWELRRLSIRPVS